MTSPIRLLRRPPNQVVVPTLDAAQRAVVEHGDGPLLVLAGPGTGKTTTLVEAVVDRIENRGADPSQVLALTFSRKAAQQLRDRITARLGRTVASPVSMTFHSFAHALMRRYTPDELYGTALRLLSAPEADVVMHEVLTEMRDELPWPESLGEAVNTRGFAAEVATVISRAREHGADEEQLIAIGRAHPDAPELLAAGLFLQNYLLHLDYRAATDYADLVRRAVIEATAHSAELREEFRYVFVDEYQDTDPGQVQLLKAIAGGGGNLVVVGDPNQSIYGFRGAEVRGILEFPQTFHTRDGADAPVVVLDTTRRFGTTLLQAATRVAGNLPLNGAIPAQARDLFLHPRAAEGTATGRVEVFTYDTERAEAERLADLLRRAHLDDGVAWNDMAVLVRTGSSTLPALRRMLSNAGVPVETATDEIPLAQEPAVRPLMWALELLVSAEEQRRARRRADEGLELSDFQQRALEWSPTPTTAHDLLTSPLVLLRATELRSVSRVLRQREVAAAAAEERPALSSGELLARALVTDDGFEGVPEDVGGRAVAFKQLLDETRDLMRQGKEVEELLWHLWEGVAWRDRLRAAVLRGGTSAPKAHRDLDALCALFDTAARLEEPRLRTDVRGFLAFVGSQALPADSLADKGVRTEAVTLTTAHRSKGLEWPMVVVAHVQEDDWPDLRRRATLLGADRLGSEQYGHLQLVGDASRAAMLAEERRLFFVACTRAKERLVITAVASNAEDGEMPSRFVDEVCTTPQQEKDGHEPVRVVHEQGRPLRPLSLAGVVADLRRTVADPEVDEALRDAAAKRLALLAAEEIEGRPLVPAADPTRWWGTAGTTLAATPVRPADRPVKLSASTVQAIAECPAKWFLEREAGGSSFSGQSAAFGNVVHKIAEHVTDPEVGEASLDELMALLDTVWDQLPFRTPWSREKEREEARKAVERFLNHHNASTRTVLGTEVAFNFTSTLPDGQQVQLRGFADRLELDAQGRVVVVDLKTGKYPPSDKSLVENPQLGIYQYAVEQGGFSDHVAPGSLSGGAELWQLRASKKDVPKVQAQAKQEPDPEGWVLAERQLAETAQTIRAEDFAAVPGSHCDFCTFRSLCPARTTSGVIS
ncbi:ATP-dependent helicase [Nocardioides yefusunii]|uniref:DNA 3'-5' helicase n=1 Tax=Nocardioides yefusunii TaxID=2500546 RepID=A0ABW1R0U2_9ACTN|nr:ATP-dependent DNA helicase [Nocardioides yefusunii]